MSTGSTIQGRDVVSLSTFSADEIAEFRKLLDDAELSAKRKRKRGGDK